jgi:hypothetical protein
MFIIVFIAHGNKGDIMVSGTPGSPEYVQIQNVRTQLDEVVSLHRIPKLIIVDSCRGTVDNNPKLPKRDSDSRNGNFFSMNESSKYYSCIAEVLVKIH